MPQKLLPAVASESPVQTALKAGLAETAIGPALLTSIAPLARLVTAWVVLGALRATNSTS